MADVGETEALNPETVATGATLTGVVKAWIDDRGMGFITPDTGGEDVFVHRSNLTDGHMLEIGAAVTFLDDWDASKNKRIATSVAGAVMKPEKGAAYPGKGAGYGPTHRAAAPAGGGAPGGAATDNLWIGDLPEDMQKEQMFDIFSAYGAVADCRVIPPKQPGQKACGLVRFSSLKEAQWIVQNLNGNIPQGLEGPITVKFAANSGSPGAAAGGKGGGAQPQQGYQTGTVKAWIDERGMGFITPSTGGEDLFVHRSHLQDGGALVIGAQVSFVEDWDYSKNKRIAKEVFGATEGGKGAAGGPGGQGGAAGDNCFVGDLPPEIDKAQLTALFEPYGTVVDCKVLPPKQPGQMACGLVRFGSAGEAQWVVEKLNGNIPHGLDTPVVVRFANNSGGAAEGSSWTPPPPTGPHPSARSSPYGAGANGAKGWAAAGGPKGKAGAKGGGKPGMAGSILTYFQGVKGAGMLGGGRAPDECQLYIKNLPPDTTDLDLYKLFAPFGAISPTGVKAMLGDDGSCKGFGFVDFVDPECALLAVQSLNGFVGADGGAIIVAQKRGNKSMAVGEAL